MRNPYLRLEGITKRFRGITALSDVDLIIDQGEVVALMGDNGAGKSTLFKIISGAHRADSGRCLVKGEPHSIESILDANRLGIQTVYQDLALCENLDTVSNLFLGKEIKAGKFPGARLHRSQMEFEAKNLLATLDVRIKSLSAPVGALSGGQRQSVAIARSVLRDPEIVLLDEPTAALGVEQTKQVLDLITRLKKEGKGVAVITHNVADALQVADRIIVLRLGKVVAELARERTSGEEIVGYITGAIEAQRSA